ncbi:MAG: PD40 domain-containing protein [Candidatus Eisenbacteria bacterium]|nr:PD40 domain-containing protein [Candidatus Eisenbacteria bacterium]
MKSWARWLPPAFLLAVALTALGAVPASAQYFGQNKVQYRRYDWRSISSDHFDVYFYAGLDSLSLRVLDLAEKAHAMLSRRMGHTLERRVPIILYGSHNDFAQTNVTPELIDAGTGGFTEVLHNRVVLPFTGSYEDLRHVVVHELTHAVMFDMLYGGSAATLIARQGFYQMPLWFAEGMAEYMSLGEESNEQMFLRDGQIDGYLPPLEYSGGYIVYKQGQSAIGYLVSRFGEERLRDILERARQMHNFEGAFQHSVGTSVNKFDGQWREWLKKRYWPTVATKQDPDHYGRRLTDHRRDESNLNTGPAISPQGDRVAYFSDRHQYTDVYVASVFDGKVERRLIRGERSRTFEGLPSFRGSLAWSPDGRSIGLVAQSDGHDVLYVVDSDLGKVQKRIELHMDAAEYPAWSPVADSMVVTGVKDGRADLYLVDLRSGAMTRLTDDNWEEKESTWTPDGRTITFVSDRLAPVVLGARRIDRGFGEYALYDLDLATRRVSELVTTYGDEHSPAWSPDGRRLAFISDRNGTPNAYLFEVRDSSLTQLSDVEGGLLSLSWSRTNDRLVYSAYNHGGFDVFAVNEPLSLDDALARLRREKPGAVLSLAQAMAAPTDSLIAPPNLGALELAWNDTLAAPRDTTLQAMGAFAAAGTPHDSTDAGPKNAAIPGDVRPHPEEPPAWEPHASDSRAATHPPGPPPSGHDPTHGARSDSLPHLIAASMLIERGGPFALSDSVLAQKPVPYKVRMSADYFGGGLYAASGLGFVGSTQLQFSDFLGDRNVYVAADLASSSLSETNILAIYNYLPGRIDYSYGAFHFKNYFSARVTSFGEALGSPHLFSDRNFGALCGMSYPFDRFRRGELNLTQTFIDRQFFVQDPATGIFYATAHEYRSITAPTVSLIGDNTLFGYYGPVNGGRYALTFSPALPLFPGSLQYHTWTGDVRRYWDLTHSYTFAWRALAGVSNGPNAQTFRVGGYSTLRGYSDFDILGTRMALTSVELRFPFIQQLGLVGPLPIGVFNMRGAAFTDFGAVWNHNDPLRFWQVNGGHYRLGSPLMGFGFGVRSSAFFLIMKLDVAWHTDFDFVSRPRWLFTIGPEF